MHPLSKAERVHVGCRITVGQGADSDRTKATSHGGYLHHQLQKKYDLSYNSQRPSKYDITKILPRSACLYPLCSVSLEFLSCQTVEAWTRSSFPELSQKSKPTKTEILTSNNENLTSWQKWRSYLTKALVIPWN